MVTRLPGEELLPECIEGKRQRQEGWMFWACFAGDVDGPFIFWEKEWGTIDSESYSARIIPIVHGWIRMHPSLQFMQDNAPGHAAKATIQELQERGIPVIPWPAVSPDLNPIEYLWNLMKDYLSEHYSSSKCTYDELRERVIQAWCTVARPEQLAYLASIMQQRCKDVIAAKGGHTKW